MTNAVNITAPDGLPYIGIVREFDAPVAAVFRAHQDPELLKQWVGPNGFEMKIDKYNFTTGGGYRYVHVDPEGGEYAFNGVFHVVRENEFAIQTFEFEGFPDVVSVESITFTDLGDGRTRLSVHSTYPNQEARDGMIESNMETGVTEGYERLDEVLANALAGAEKGEMTMDWTLEVVVLPVSDIARSIEFYRDKIGFNLDHDTTNEHMHVAQLTPPGSGCSIVIGDLPSHTEMKPGSMKGLQLVVSDAYAARDELSQKGVEVSEITVFDERDGGTFFGFEDPDGNSWGVQQIKARGDKPLIPKGHDTTWT